MANWGVPPTTGSRLPHIDGARALAASSIVVYHVWRYGAAGGPPSLGPPGRVMPHLALGVTLFVTLSGFLLYRPFAAALARGRPRPDLAAYLRNRALRILPAYWFILLITGLVMGTTLVRYDLQRGSLASRPSLLVRDAFLVQNTIPRRPDGIGPAWSLAIEVAFYLALPILGLVAFALADRARKDTRRRRSCCFPRSSCWRLASRGSSLPPPSSVVRVPGSDGLGTGTPSSSGASRSRATSSRTGCSWRS